MFKKTFPLGIMLVLSFSCSNDDNGFEAYDFYENSTIVLDEYGYTQIETGQNLVFEYYLKKDDEPQIADDEYAEQIIFEIESGLDAFSISDENLSEANVYFNKYCFCAITGSIPINQGTIIGTKLEDRVWEISIDVEFEDYNEQSRMLSGAFVLSSE